MTTSACRTIVFVSANSSYAHTNLAEWYLRGSIAGLGWRWKTVELVAGEEPYPALNRVLAHRPRVVAASLYVFNRACVMSILRRIKAAIPACRVIVGGPELLGDNRAILEQERCIDAAVRGEGETAFRDVLQQLGTPHKWRDINGVCGIVDGAYVDNGFARPVPRLDDIPSPYRACLPEAVARHKPFVQLETSRGCRNSCAFCTSAGGGLVRYFTVERVRADLEIIRAAGIRNVRIVDRTFNDNARRCVELLRMFHEEFGDLDFHLEIDPAKAGPPVLAQLSAARPGQLHMDAGLQSFDGAVMKACRRRGGAEKTAAGLARLCAIKGVAVHADLIAGLPGQKLATVFDDVGRLTALAPAEIQLELLKLLPGTRLDAERDRWGLVASPEPPYEIIRTAQMTEEAVFEAHWLCKLVDWFYEPKQLRRVVLQAGAEMPGFWRKLCRRCMAKHGAWMRPSLANRFLLLKAFFEDHRKKRLVHALAYEWMWHGLGPGGGVCNAEPCQQGVPEGAVLVEGDPQAEVSQWHAVTLERQYFFGYARGKRRDAVVVWRWGRGKG